MQEREEEDGDGDEEEGMEELNEKLFHAAVEYVELFRVNRGAQTDLGGVEEMKILEEMFRELIEVRMMELFVLS